MDGLYVRIRAAKFPALRCRERANDSCLITAIDQIEVTSLSTNEFTWGGFWLRALFALVLVSATYNPLGYSLSHLVLDRGDAMPMSMLALFAVVLLIGWVIYLRATLRSLGVIGLILAGGVFGTLIWVMFDFGILNFENPGVLSWIGIVVVSLILAIGMSWSHVRRRMSGQLDTDEVEGE